MVNFDAAAKRRILEAIRLAEKGTSGEIRVHLSSRSVEEAYGEAEKTFRKLRMHRTRERNGVLIFVAPKSRLFAVYGDAGIHAKAGAGLWERTRDRMTAEFAAGRPVEGIVEGVRLAGEALQAHFPRRGDDANELPDTVTEE